MLKSVWIGQTALVCFDQDETGAPYIQSILMKHWSQMQDDGADEAAGLLFVATGDNEHQGFPVVNGYCLRGLEVEAYHGEGAVLAGRVPTTVEFFDFVRAVCALISDNEEFKKLCRDEGIVPENYSAALSIETFNADVLAALQKRRPVYAPRLLTGT
jgi:hypothetical protein